MTRVTRRTLLAGGAAMAGTLAFPVEILAQQASPVASPTATPIPPVANSDQFNVLFIRHAESLVNVAPDPNVPDDGVSYPLTQLGTTQAAALATKLGNIDISAIYTSTRVRCIQTGTALSLAHDLVINLAPQIVETSFGDTTTDIAQIYSIMGAWAQGDMTAAAPGGETLKDQLDRFLPFVNATIDQYKDQPKALVFVAHGAILGTCLPRLFTNVDPVWALQNGFANTGIASGTFVNGQLVCTSWQGVAPQ